MKTAFIGHRQIFAKDIIERLANAVRTEIDNDCMAFTIKRKVYNNGEKLIFIIFGCSTTLRLYFPINYRND